MKSSLINILFVVTLAGTTSISQAEVFRWVDDEGKVHIGVKPADNPKPEQPREENTAEKASQPARKKVFLDTPAPAPKVTAPTVAAPKAVAPAAKPVASETVSAPKLSAVKQSPAEKPAAKVVKKPVVKKPRVVKKAVKKPAVKKKTKKLVKSKKPAPVKKKVAKKKAVKDTAKRNEEMCGVYTTYVDDYNDKVRNCAASACDIYKRSLARYQKKQKAYCG